MGSNKERENYTFKATVNTIHYKSKCPRVHLNIIHVDAIVTTQNTLGRTSTMLRYNNISFVCITRKVKYFKLFNHLPEYVIKLKHHSNIYIKIKENYFFRGMNGYIKIIHMINIP